MSSLNQQDPLQAAHGFYEHSSYSHTYAVYTLPQNQQFTAPAYPLATATQDTGKRRPQAKMTDC
eukprot:1142524-Pelagomonas_calceolata.AAC.3